MDNMEEWFDDKKQKFTEEVKKNLKTSFEIFNNLYFELFEKYMKENSNKEEIIDDLEKIIIELEKNSQQKLIAINEKNWNVHVVEKIPLILAHVFVIWTFQNSDLEFFNPSGNKDRENFKIMKPHPVQIVSIFRLLGVDKLVYDENVKKNIFQKFTGFFASKIFENSKNQVNSTNLDNHLIEIKTGEGKSVTLAISALVLAFFGYEVNVVCYR